MVASLVPSYTTQSLPVELLPTLLSFCCPSTLSAWSATSYSVLKLAGPLLYETVTVKEPEDYLLLFRDSVRRSLISVLLRTCLQAEVAGAENWPGIQERAHLDGSTEHPANHRSSQTDASAITRVALWCTAIQDGARS
jgi:hypothetical protein